MKEPIGTRELPAQFQNGEMYATGAAQSLKLSVEAGKLHYQRARTTTEGKRVGSSTKTGTVFLTQREGDSILSIPVYLR